MKVKKINNKYYVNDLDLEEVMANRKYVYNYIKRQISYYESIKKGTADKNKILNYLTVFYDIQNKMKLRK